MQSHTRWLRRAACAPILALTIVLASAGSSHAQFPAYGGGGVAVGYPGWGYGGFYGGYGGYGGYGYGYPGGAVPYGYGYGYPAYAYGGYPGFQYYGFGYGNPGFYTPGLANPLFGVGMTPLGVRSYLYETQVLGRRSMR